MSATYSEILEAIEAAFTSVGAEVRWVTEAPTQRVSVKATAGPGVKLVATFVQLDLNHTGRGCERSDSLTTGRFVFSLQATKLSNDPARQSLATIADAGDRALSKLDGSGVRTGNRSVTMVQGKVTFSVAIVGAHIVTMTDTNTLFAGGT